MGILSGVLSYIFGLILNMIDAAVDGFLAGLSFGLDSFETYFPAAADYHEVLMGFSLGLLFIFMIFQVFKNFGVPLDIEAEDPLKILGKTVLFFGMILYHRSITDFITKLLVDPYRIFVDAPKKPYEFELRTLVTGLFDSAFSNPFYSIIVLLMMLKLGWEFLKLCAETIERYLVFNVIIYHAPIVFSTGPFKFTSQIFKSWGRMVGSHALLMLLNIWCIKLFMSFMPVFEMGGSDIGSIVFCFLLGLGFLKFAQKADTLLRILGLNTASTGDMMRVMGSSVAGVAHAFRGAARGLAGGAGGFGRYGRSGGSGVGSGGNSGGGAGGSSVPGMGISTPPAPSGGGGAGALQAPSTKDSGTSSGLTSAKQKYTNDVLGSAKDQISNTPLDDAFGDAQGFGNPTGDSSNSQTENSNLEMKSAGSQSNDGVNTSPRNIDGETMEGLANVAHGLPHNQYDPETKQFSGGGFGEFTGENANLIGASQLMPADGYSQSQVKMDNGESGTVYSNPDTGDSQLVQFASVDNGVIQGTISEINPSTGAMGDAMHFKAVHDSVPGASSFSEHSEPIADSQGGTYHIATGASTSFFAPGGTNMMQHGSESVSQPGAAQQTTAPPIDNTPAPAGVGNAPSQPQESITMQSQAESGGSTAPLPSSGTGDDSTTIQSTGSQSSSLHVSGAGEGGGINPSGLPQSGSSPSTSQQAGGSTSVSSPLAASMSQPVNTPSDTANPGIQQSYSSSPLNTPLSTGGNNNMVPQNNNLQASTPQITSSSANSGNATPGKFPETSPPQTPNARESASQNQISRFSKTNPANLEIFQRGNSVESYQKGKPDATSSTLDNM